MKGSKLFMNLLVITIAASFCGCFYRSGIKGNGNVISQERPVTEFSGIVVAGAGNINIHQSESHRVTVRTDSNLQDITEARTVNGSLLIRQKNNSGFTPTEFVIDIYMPELKNITVNGAANINVMNGKTPDLTLDVSGACKIDAANYEAQNVTIDLSGAGDVRVWATATLNYTLSGFGNIRFKGSPALNGKISGLGKINPL